MPAHTIPAQAWDDIRAEFTLPALDQVRRRLSELMEDPEPIMRQLVRVFLSGLRRLSRSSSARRRLNTSQPRLGSPHGAALEATPSTDLDGGRPVDRLADPSVLESALSRFVRR